MSSSEDCLTVPLSSSVFQEDVFFSSVICVTSLYVKDLRYVLILFVRKNFFSVFHLPFEFEMFQTYIHSLRAVLKMFHFLGLGPWGSGHFKSNVIVWAFPSQK